MRTAIGKAIRRQPRLNNVRKLVRFAQQVPLGDWRDPRARAAFTVRPYTKLSYRRLAAIYELAGSVPSGAFVECGVWHGGASAMAALADPHREMWLFDSWEGLPEPGEFDIAIPGHTRPKGWIKADQRRVEHLFFERLRLPYGQVHLVKGWFEDTLPDTRESIGPIALLHLDGDWYESIKTCLEQFYENVVPGGAVVVDDYYFWQGCTKAVDEFMSGRSPVGFTRVDGAVHWRKP